MTKRTILLVDNDPVYLQIAQEYLETHKFHVISVSNASEARQMLLEEKIDVAILDIRLTDETDMRDRQGLHLAKDTMWGQYVPKIMLTRHESVEYAVASLRPNRFGQAPAVNFVMKHEGLDILLAAIKKALVVDLAKLRRFLNTFFNESELQELCEDCHLKYDELTGRNKRDKVRELVAYFERRGRERDLLQFCRQRRPRAPW